MMSLGIKRFKETYGYDPWCHESSLCCLLGLLVGGAIKFFTGSTVQFDNDVFFYVVLPPIIFSAGMSLKKKMFFKYISLITLFGVVGTVINFMLITAITYHGTRFFQFKDTYHKPVLLSWEHSMLLGAVLCGTDEVSALSLMPMHTFPRLGALIFGEGVLNDAISIVLFHVLMSNHSKAETDSTTSLRHLAFKLILEVTNEVFLSFIIGVSCGLANARLLKSLTYLRHHPVHQTVLLLLFAYLAYTIAESMDVSGILTLFVAAVVQGHYSWHSLSKPAQVGMYT
jgi:sodium/hydrogen exchanger 8